jgi:hypothetical protein
LKTKYGLFKPWLDGTPAITKRVAPLFCPPRREKAEKPNKAKVADNFFTDNHLPS